MTLVIIISAALMIVTMIVILAWLWRVHRAVGELKVQQEVSAEANKLVIEKVDQIEETVRGFQESLENIRTGDPVV